jgi:hypothetical protein
MSTEMGRSVSRCIEISLFWVTTARHTSAWIISHFFARTHMVLRVLVLVSVTTSSEPRSSHTELVGRSSLLCWFSCRPYILLWVCGACVKLQSPSRRLRIHRNMLIFAFMARKLFAVTGQLLWRATFALQQIIWFRPL